MLGLDDFSYKVWRDRQEVDRVGLLGAHLIGLNWGNVWVHKYCFQFLLLQNQIKIELVAYSIYTKELKLGK